jgi:hypothetical protein
LVESEDPLDAEMLGAMLLAASPGHVDELAEAMAASVVPALASVERQEAVALLLAIGSVVPDPAGTAATTAAGQLTAAGVPEPAWASALAEPVSVGDCWELRESHGFGSILACEFRRGEHSHGALVTVDDLHCGAADQATLLDGGELPAALEELVAESAEWVTLETHRVDPAMFRRKLEAAMDSRAVHDEEDVGLPVAAEESEDGEAGDDLFDEDGGPGYALVASLLRARMRALPEPAEPKPSHGGPEGGQALSPAMQQILSRIAGDGTSGLLGPAELPPKRSKQDGPAPVYQIKVGLRGAKPPIWRRLEVPGNVSLAKLHDVIQAAFGWYGGHLHVFETPYGDFGAADGELGHRSEKPVTLEQVAPAERSKFRYTYDFGDDWEHEIVVEKLLDRQRGTTYPRCTGGRRAAPPDDCGGIGGYEMLLETLAVTSHPEHEDMLEWMGLDSGEDFDPAAFDKHDVTAALPRVR